MIPGFVQQANQFFLSSQQILQVLTKDRITKQKDSIKTGLNRTQNLIETCNARNKFCTYS